MQTCMEIVSRCLSEGQSRVCEHALTLDELTIALMKLIGDKSPRSDGFPCEFDKTMWDFVGHDLLWVYKEANIRC
jgi:hypothetical protein